MLYGICVILFSIISLFLILVVMVQRGHGGFWTGPGNNDSTALFGGSGGTDILQKVTWACGIILIIATLGLSIYKARLAKRGKYVIAEQKAVTLEERTRELQQEQQALEATSGSVETIDSSNAASNVVGPQGSTDLPAPDVPITA